MVVSCEEMGVVLRPSVVMHMPTFCTLLSLLVLLLGAVAQVNAPYSIRGQVFPVCTFFKILLFTPQLVLASFFISDSHLVDLLSVPCGPFVRFDNKVHGQIFL